MIYTLKKVILKLKQLSSECDKNLKELIINTINIKRWIIGIQNYCIEKFIQNYLDKYHFRFNRRSNMGTIFDVLSRKMVN